MLQTQCPGRSKPSDCSDFVEPILTLETRKRRTSLHVRVQAIEDRHAKIVIHQQADQVWIAGKRPTVGVVGR